MKFKFEKTFKNNENKSGKSVFHKFTFIWGQEQCKYILESIFIDMSSYSFEPALGDGGGRRIILRWHFHSAEVWYNEVFSMHYDKVVLKPHAGEHRLVTAVVYGMMQRSIHHALKQSSTMVSKLHPGGHCGYRHGTWYCIAKC